MKTVENAGDRYIKASKQGKFNYSCELKILNHLVNKFNQKSKSTYANKQSISIPAVSKRIKSGKVMCIEIAGKTFIID